MGGWLQASLDDEFTNLSSLHFLQVFHHLNILFRMLANLHICGIPLRTWLEIHSYIYVVNT